MRARGPALGAFGNPDNRRERRVNVQTFASEQTLAQVGTMLIAL